jgi:putative addiction module CopG family antidote
MTVRLKPELDAMIQDDLERGQYQSVDEFVERAVQMLHEHEQSFAGKRVLHARRNIRSVLGGTKP